MTLHYARAVHLRVDAAETKRKEKKRKIKAGSFVFMLLPLIISMEFEV
jgi:hypothetical protein